MAAKETQSLRERECWQHRKQKDREKDNVGCIGNRKKESDGNLGNRKTEREKESDGSIGNRKTERKRVIAA